MVSKVTLRDGMKVKVIAVPPDEEYADTLGKYGKVEGVPWTDESGTWVFVVLDGERLATEYKADELEATTIETHEGIVDASGKFDWMYGSVDVGIEYRNKKVVVTVEVVDGE